MSNDELIRQLRSAEIGARVEVLQELCGDAADALSAIRGSVAAVDVDAIALEAAATIDDLPWLPVPRRKARFQIIIIEAIRKALGHGQP